MRAVILGGGPAGAAAAITLAQGGISAVLLERSRETGDALCGGFLSWRTLDALARLGIDADTLNPNPVTQVRLFAGNRVAETRLPRAARGVSRRRLDTLLLTRAAALGAGIERGVTVRGIGAGTARLADGAEISADVMLLATGKHDVRGAAREDDASDPTLGLRVRIPASPTLERLIDGSIELYLFDRGYAGIVLQEDGSANVCMALRRSRLREAGDPKALLALLATECPRLGERLAGFEGIPIDAVANVPYGWRARGALPGVYRIGDQAGVIPSLAGEGMGIAIASGTAAARAILAGAPSEQFQPAFARRLVRPLTIAGAVWYLAERPAAARALIGLAHLPPIVRTVARLTRIKHLGR